MVSIDYEIEDNAFGPINVVTLAGGYALTKDISPNLPHIPLDFAAVPSIGIDNESQPVTQAAAPAIRSSGAVVGGSSSVPLRQRRTTMTIKTHAKTQSARITKIGPVIALLKRKQGTTLAEVVAATDWLPHTARAALTGLKKKGHIIEHE